MDRAAKLAEATRHELLEEKCSIQCGVSPENTRATTRRVLGSLAFRLGFAPNEISAAIDQALTDAGTTP